ncbi:MAG: hypothetical protein U0271_31155 [Polyangiaceae bacterium]
MSSNKKPSRSRKPLALPFVATLAACGASGQGPEGPHHNPPALLPTLHHGKVPAAPGVKETRAVGKTVGSEDYYSTRNEDGSQCFLNEDMSCPKNASCNPPPPVEGECAGHGTRPAGWENTMRIPSTFWAGQWGCSYTEEMLCPLPKSGGGDCSEAFTYTLSCTATPDPTTKKNHMKVPAFAYGNTMGECFFVEAFECEEGSCALPEAKKIDCSP